MRPTAAWLLVTGLAAASVAVLFLPPAVLAVAAVGAWIGMRRRLGFTLFAAVTMAINALLLAWLTPGPGLEVGPVGLSGEGARDGVVAALRLIALLGLNLAVLQAVAPARLLDGLRLPPHATGFLAAVLVAAHDLGRDFDRIRAARRLEGQWPRRRWRRAGVVARMMPALFVAAHDRAGRRRDALRLAGLDTGPRFAPIVAVTALAVAGRLALVSFPNVALTYVIVFLGGVVFGVRVGFWSAVWSMLLTDLMLSGFFLPAFVNIPAMALLGVLGGSLRDLDWDGASRMDRWAGHAFAAAVGVVGTFMFSMAADTLTWALIPEQRQSVAFLRTILLAGLAFNVVPAVTNGVLFTIAVAPVARAFRARRQGTASAPAARSGTPGPVS